MKGHLVKAFEDLNTVVCEWKEFDSTVSGAALTVVLVEGDTLYCANVGSLKALLIWEGKPKYFVKGSSTTQGTI